MTMPPALRPTRVLGLALPVTLAIAMATETGQRGSADSATRQDSTRRFVDVIEVTGAITPITVEQVETQLRQSEANGAKALVLVMDTPGGLESSMRSIVKAILASRIPVVTWVSPPGARAASAGLFIVTASHVAAMAPNTNLGAASPVSIGGPADTTMAKKATSDAAALIQGLAETRGRNAEWNVKAVREAVSASANEAVGLRVVDFVASDLRAVLEKASGRTVQVGGGPLRLDLAGAEIHQIAPTRRHRVLSWLANPNVAYLLLTLGFYGVLFELQSPGAILPGVAGAILLILGFVALQMLPVNVAGLALMLLAMAFFVLEIKVQSHGVLAVGGIASFLFGSLMLFEPGPGRLIRVSLPIVLGATAATAALFTFVVGMALGAQRRPVTTGAEGMLAEIGEAITPLDPRGRVRVHGEIWEAESGTGPVEAGTHVEVTRVRGLTLEVRARSTKGD